MVFWGADLPGETDFDAISKRIYEVVAGPPWLTLKHHLFATHIPTKLLKARSGTPLNDKTDVCKKGYCGDYLTYLFQRLQMS